MVGRTAVLARIPVIKFRKGAVGHSGTSTGPSAAPAASVGAQAAAASGQQSAPMSTGVLPDIDLPPRYRRQPLSQEEIDHINGGGIV